MLISKFDLYKSEWLELVFEKRNKNYGAYELRQHYSQTMLKALSVTIFGLIAGSITVAVVTRSKPLPVNVPDQTTIVNLIDPNKILVPPAEKPKPKAALPHSDFKPHPVQPTVVIPTRMTTEPVRTDPPTLDQINTSVIGSDAIKGTGQGQNVEVATTGQTGTGDSMGTGNTNGTEILDVAEVAPEPAGGVAGWTKFLQKNLRYPDTEAQGRVFVSFIVEKDGSLSSIKVERGVTPELDAEALRVLKMAPKWKPGQQNHQNVRVKFTIPINFQITNQ